MRVFTRDAKPKLTRQVATSYATCSIILQLVSRSIRSKSWYRDLVYRSSLCTECANSASQRHVFGSRTSVAPVDVVLWRASNNV